jgi:hypothetical protein
MWGLPAFWASYSATEPGLHVLEIGRSMNRVPPREPGRGNLLVRRGAAAKLVRRRKQMRCRTAREEDAKFPRRKHTSSDLAKCQFGAIQFGSLDLNWSAVPEGSSPRGSGKSKAKPIWHLFLAIKDN